MVGLAGAVYNPRPGEVGSRAARLPDPADLCDAAPDDIKQDLFEAFVRAAYRRHTGPRWPAPQAERALVCLARHLRQTDTVDLTWWELARSVPRYRVFVLGCIISVFSAAPSTGLIGGLVAGFPHGCVFGIAFGCGLAAGVLTSGLGFTLGQGDAPAVGVRWDWTGFLRGIGFGVVFGLVCVALFSSAYGIAIGLILGIAGGIERSPADITMTVGPTRLLAKDRSVYLLGNVAFGIPFGLAVALAARFADRLGDRLPLGLVTALTIVAGLTVGGAFGLAVRITDVLGSWQMPTGWGVFVITRLYHALRGQLPWKLMDFLDDAHQRGVLRQVGTAYQFRHVDLQNHLANRP
jgi:hypothetical protein